MSSNARGKSDKKDSYKFRRGLAFEADDTPNFLKILQTGGVARAGTDYSGATTADAIKRAREADEEEWDRLQEEDSAGQEGVQDRVDERPQVEMGKGVTAGEVDRFFGIERGEGSGDGTVLKRDADDKPESSEEEENEDGTIKFRKPKRSCLVSAGTAAVGPGMGSGVGSAKGAQVGSRETLLKNKLRQQRLDKQEKQQTPSQKSAKKKKAAQSLLSFDDNEEGALP
ncbi:hypothetical protein BSLG_005412 [Batrachochytrium salamandrivorans]|nr:hypothetical protein BASA62_001559 [Batrachochytrium salamandrivorans]KAJ1339977.1 hypothetical protein BSLG_005412 [Batrachochytrium salamandrivorans]